MSSIELNFSGLPITIINASEVVEMHDNPLDVLKKKKDSSINVAMNLLNDGEGDAFFSAVTPALWQLQVYLF